MYVLLSQTEYQYRILSEEYKELSFTGKDLEKEILWIRRDHLYSTSSLKEKIYNERKFFYENESNDSIIRKS